MRWPPKAIAVITSLAGRTIEPRRPAGRDPDRRIRWRGRPGGLSATRRVSMSSSMPRIPTRRRSAPMPSRPVSVAGRPLLRFERAPWQPQKGDRWIIVDSLAAAAKVAPGTWPPRLPHHRRQGTGELSPASTISGFWFAWSTGRRSRFRCAHYELILARGPFELADEHALMRTAPDRSGHRQEQRRRIRPTARSPRPAHSACRFSCCAGRRCRQQKR